MPVKQKLNQTQYLLLFGLLMIIFMLGMLIFYMYKRSQRKIEAKRKITGKYQIAAKPQQTLLTEMTTSNYIKQENNLNLSQIQLKN